MTNILIPHFGIARQYTYLKEELLHATDLVLSSGQLINGVYGNQLEAWLRNRTGAKHALLVHSGTQALEFIASYVGAQHRAEPRPIINVPNLTYPATLNAFDPNYWRINLLDTDASGLIDPNQYGVRNYTCYVGLYGANTVSSGLQYYSNSWLIVDGAQHWLTVIASHGAEIGIGMSISFDPTKNLSASGNGGAVLTNSNHMYDHITHYQDNGKPNWHESGTNSKLGEIDCAHLLVRTKYIDAWQNRRQQISDYYIQELENLPIRCLRKGFKTHANQKFVIYTNQRDDLHVYLTDECGIETKMHYPYTLGELQLSTHVMEKPDMISTSVMLSRGLLSLPMHPELTDAEIETITEKIKQFFN